MTIKEIPQSFLYTCDGCGKEENLKTRSRPKYWVEIKILADAYDYQGAAVADASSHRLLCATCYESFGKAINETFRLLKASK